jgi:glyoxylase-like metal-dependent hydrolase (beta-lactamase superfamily II)
MGAVRIRMYRQGLGDCFLLTFSGGAAPFHALIDCGVLKGTPDADTRMHAVADDIRATTGGRLDVLIATHEHWDHVSGFLQAGDVLGELTVAEVWLAWTEDPDDALATELRRHRAELRQAVAAAARGLAAAGSPAAERIGALLDFEGDLGVGARATTAGALQWVKDRPGAQLRLLRPGEQVALGDAVPGLRAFVLGPPHDRTQIKRSDPSKRASEVYEIGSGGAESGFYAAVAAIDAGAAPDEQPFDRFFRVPPADAAAQPFFAAGYLADDAAWRRIDHDWLGVAAPLALQLDSDTNNTSLALAFELGAGGRVLLFPGDAQVGNWLSWGELAWELEERGAKRALTSADLLARTSLYKVGHHASHNATLREHGLELMTSPDLVAMIPVHRPTALKKKWNMPFPPLLARLEERTGGRILDAELGLLHDDDAAFVARTTVSEWFVDYTLEW